MDILLDYINYIFMVDIYIMIYHIYITILVIYWL
jgi:hypothetical protein